jgi:N4-bis(aminopropyl)spermidine synthase
VPNGHPDLVSEAAQTALTDLLKAKYTLRFLRSQPDAKHAIVLAESVPPQSLDVPGRVAQYLLRRVHGKLGNVWREGLIEAAAEHGHALAKRPARALVEARAYPPWALRTRLIDLPRHQIARILADAMASATDTGQPQT